MIDLGRALKSAVNTGKVVFGVQQTEKMIKSGEAKLIIVATNCPSDYVVSKSHGVPVYQYNGTNMELGALCGKPFSVSSIAVIDKGASNILSLG
ncbi:MAG: 50S ribosomal protein L30e [Methanomassiliicoccales archaeon]|nr:50S ribosomal protein L30e [Methanomassiliicoccales archaeon]